MRVLVVGCGSIGRRHINNLIALDKIKAVSIYTKVKDCLKTFNDASGKVSLIEDLDNAEADFAVICNETYKHLETAIVLTDRGMDLFIEKPVSYNLDNVDRLKKITDKNKTKVFIGYNLRFLGAMRYIKEQLKDEIIGDLYFAKIETGQYLPEWRKDIDYRQSYSAFREKGGGVSLDLSHEIDYMRYLFGNPLYWKVVKTKVSKLEIDSDDVFEGLYVYGNNFVCNVHLDYLQKDKRREISIVGSKGILQCDFIEEEIRVKKENGIESIIDNIDCFDIDKTYVDELDSFIMSIENDIEPRITLDDGIKALELIEDM